MPLLPGAAAVPVSCAADFPEATGKSGEERSLGAEGSVSQHPHPRAEYSRLLFFFSDCVLDYF